MMMMMMMMMMVVVVVAAAMVMVMQWNLRINGILYQWLHHKCIVSSIISRHWLCLSFHVCSKTCCDLLLQSVQCKIFIPDVQSNCGYYQEIKVGNGVGHICAVRHTIGILCDNNHLSLPTVTALHV